MKYLLFLLAFPLLAQPQAHVYVATSPTGACTARAVPQIRLSTGAISTCANGTWVTEVPGGGGPPTGAAGGDLSGTYPNPSVAKINGISVTGTPSTGQVPTATSSSAATWQTPAGASPAGSAGNLQTKLNSTTFGATASTDTTCASYGDCTTLTQISTVQLDASAFEIRTRGTFLDVSGGTGGVGYLETWSLSNLLTPIKINTVSSSSPNGPAWYPFPFGKFCYFTTSNSPGTAQIWDCTTTNSASLVSTITAPDSDVIYASEIVGSKWFLATGSGPGTAHLYRYDITNRAAPVLEASVALGANGADGGSPHMLIIENEFAYIAITPTTDNTPMLDIVNTQTMSVVGTLNAPDGNSVGGFGSMVKRGPYLYMLDTVSGGTCVSNTGAGCAMRIVNVGTPSSPTLVKGLLNGSTYTPFDMVGFGGRLYAAWANISGTTCPAQCEIEAFDLLADPTTPNPIAGYDLGAGTAMALSGYGKYLLAVDDSSVAHIIDTPGFDVPSMSIDQLHVGSLIVDQDTRLEGTLLANTGVKAGPIGMGSQGPVSGTNYLAPRCASAASPAVCVSYPTGHIAFPTGVTSVALTVNTTAVTANSEIFVATDDTLGADLGITCNSTLATLVGGVAVTAKTAGTSFTVTYNGTIATNPLCASYWIIN